MPGGIAVSCRGVGHHCYLEAKIQISGTPDVVVKRTDANAISCKSCKPTCDCDCGCVRVCSCIYGNDMMDILSYDFAHLRLY